MTSLNQLLDSVRKSLGFIPTQPLKSPHYGQQKNNSFKKMFKSHSYPVSKLKRAKVETASHSHDSKQIVGYHGTPSMDNAKSILKDGWMVGSGNAMGDGVYFAKDSATSKSYGSGGVYLKCLIYLGKTCWWNNQIQQQYDRWCKAKGVVPNNSAMTSFLLQKGYKTVQNNAIIVVLRPQYANPSAFKKKDTRIRILSIHRTSDDQKIRI